jgi:hypothetical protein
MLILNYLLRYKNTLKVAQTQSNTMKSSIKFLGFISIPFLLLFGVIKGTEIMHEKAKSEAINLIKAIPNVDKSSIEVIVNNSINGDPMPKRGNTFYINLKMKNGHSTTLRVENGKIDEAWRKIPGTY